MKRFIFGLIAGFVLSCAVAKAGIITSPPPSDIPVQTQQYLFNIWQNMNRPEVVTSDPNGSRKGKKGDLVLFNNSGTFSLEVNTTGSTVWQTL